MQHVTAAGSRGEVLERPRYFPRQLMTPDELTLEADYFRDRLRRHNMHLHGWGVVCGALVCVVPTPAEQGGGPKPWVVWVQPGYVLGPYGDEIVIGAGCEVSLQGTGLVVDSDDPEDPWCTEVYVERPDGPLYVAVRYREIQVRPVRAQPAGCGCDETSCEYSRYRDGYDIGILDACPDSHRTDGTGKGAEDRNPTCPAVPDSPWVVLAEVEVADDGTITRIDNCSCRRIVASARDNWYRCGSTEPPPTVLGCVEVVALIQGLELTPEAHLFEALQAGDVAQVDQLIAQGVGALGSVNFTIIGPDQSAFDSVTSKVKTFLNTHVPVPGTVVWVDEDWPGRGGDAETRAKEVANKLLDAAGLPPGEVPTQAINFSGKPCGVRLFVVFSPKPPPPVLGCVEVVALINGLELTPEAHLREAFDAGDVAQVDQLIAQGVGALGTLSFTINGPDQSAFGSVTAKVKDFLNTFQPRVPGTVVWVDEDWPGRGGDTENRAKEVADKLLDAAGLPPEDRVPAQATNFSGTPCGVRLFVRRGGGSP